MEIQGKVVKILPMQTGESARGGWKKQDFILETPGQYPKKVCISLWGDKIDSAAISEGEDISASINIESREFNERWYTDVRAWKVSKGMVSNPSQPISTNTPPPPSSVDMPNESDDLEGDLPF